MQNNNWFVKSKKNGNVYGPYSSAFVQSNISDGKINDEFYLSQNKTSWMETGTWKFENGDSKKLLNYELLEELGRGGMGVVYKAFDHTLQRYCAIKVLLPSLTNQPKAIERFLAEAQAIGKIQHPNIIHIHQVYTTPYHFFAMDYIEGCQLDDYIRSLTLSEKLSMFVKICDGMIYAHRKNILHRDLKPSNILVCKNGEPVIVDFGLAKNIEQTNSLTKTGEILGTPRYMAPEVTQGENSKSSDIYSLGVILYEFLTGHVPFDGENLMELLYEIVMTDPVPPSALNVSIKKNSDLEVICLHALEKKPEKRIRNVAFLKEEVERAILNQPIKLKPPSLYVRVKKWCVHNYMVVTLFFTVLSGVVLTLILLGYTFIDTQDKLLKNSKILLEKQIEDIHGNTSFNSVDSIVSIMRTAETIENILNSQNQFPQKYNPLTNHLETRRLLQENYSKLKNRLKFIVLAKLPEIKTIPFVDNTIIENAYISPGEKYVAQKKWHNDKKYWDFWEYSDNIQEFSYRNVAFSIPANLEKKPRLQDLLFSPDEKFVTYEDGKAGEISYVCLYDIDKRRNILRMEGSISDASFAADGSLFTFSKRKGEEEIVFVYDTQKNIIIKEIVGSRLQHNILFSKNCKWLIIPTEGKLVIYNKDKNITDVLQEDVLKRSYQVIFDDENEHLLILCRFNHLIYDLRQQKITSEVVFLDREINVKAKCVGMGEFVFCNDSGDITYVNIHNNLWNYKNYYKHSSTPVFAIEAAHPGLLLLNKNRYLELYNTFTTNIIAQFSESEKIYQQSLKNNDKTSVAYVTASHFKKYTINSKKYELPLEMQKIIRGYSKLSSGKRNAMRNIFQGDDFVLLEHVNGFCFWSYPNSEKTIRFQNVSLIKPRYLKMSRDNELLAAAYYKNIINVYKSPNFELIKEDILAPIRKDMKVNDINALAFSNDKKQLYFATDKRELFSYELDTGKYIVWNQPFTIERIEIQSDDTLILSNGTEDIIFVSPSGKTSTYNLVKNNEKENKSAEIFTISNKLIAVAEENNIYFWKLDSKEYQQSITIDSLVIKMQFSPDDRYLAVLGADHFYIYDTVLQEVYQAYTGFHKGEDFQFSPDWNKLYFTDMIGNVIVYDELHFFDQQNFYEKIKLCDLYLKEAGKESTTSLYRLISDIEIILDKK